MFYLQGSYRCGSCKTGFLGNAFYGCYSDNFCITGKHNCSINASCTYIGPGLFGCEVSNANKPANV